MVLGALFAVCAASAGCSGTFNTTVNINATISVTTTVDRDHVPAGSAVPCDINVTGAYLVEPSATPPPDHVQDAVHVQIYLDDLNSTPILITAQTHVEVTIPEGTPEGPHHIHCRLHKHDGTPTNVVFTVDVTVQVSVGGGNDAGSTVDAASSVDAG
jgi:hypothetical protein